MTLETPCPSLIDYNFGWYNFYGRSFLLIMVRKFKSLYIIKGMFEDQSLHKSFVKYANSICLFFFSGATPDRQTRAGTSGGHGTMGHEVNIHRSSKSMRTRTPNL